MNQKEVGSLLPQAKKSDRNDENFQNFQEHIGVGKDGNMRKEDGGVYGRKYEDMNAITENVAENMLVNEEEATDKLPPNMPNYDPFLES